MCALRKSAGHIGLQPGTVRTDHQSLQSWHKEHVDTQSGQTARCARWHKLLAKFDLMVVYVPGHLNTVADCLGLWVYPASKGLADISMHGDEAETAEAKRIIKLEEHLERGDAHCFVVMVHRADGAPKERTSALAQRETSVAHKRQVAQEAWLLNTKAPPLKPCLAEDWEEDCAKSEYWATHWVASSKPESELAWPAGLRVDHGKLFVFDKLLIPEARMDQVVQEGHDQRLLHLGLEKMRLDLNLFSNLLCVCALPSGGRTK